LFPLLFFPLITKKSRPLLPGFFMLNMLLQILFQQKCTRLSAKEEKAKIKPGKKFCCSHN